MPESEEPKRTQKKKPPSTADILKKIRQKKGQAASKTGKPKSTSKKSSASKPKVAQPKTAKPKKPVPTKQKPKPERVEEPDEKPVSGLDLEDLPSFLDEPSTQETKPETQTESEIPPRKPHKRFVSSKVIPKSGYRRMKDIIFKRWFLQLVVLFWLTCIVGYAITVVLTQFGYRESILENVDKGWIALEEGNENEARRIFQETLTFYKTYRVGFSKYLWFNDGQTEIAVLNMAQGWRNLGEMEKGIECFQQVCLHDPFTTNTWMDETMRNQILTFIDRLQWGEDELQQLYRYLLAKNPKEWDVGEIYLPLMTEWVAMQIYPTGQRFAKAYDVVYGTPMPINESRNSFTVKNASNYKQDQTGDELTILYPTRISSEEKERLQWYVNQDIQCVFFCQELEGAYLLDGIEGIQMNDIFFMEDFNTIVQTFSYQ